ncbi:MAG: SDR family NAD(P)-dependent oxidoreductase [Desulfobacteraceae bacterium]|nr:MAG: SDR family NAD(P)-dependent oxidoreductase [Desulfobacteraceae bacterium]
MSRYELKGRHALITGASSGIGKELSRCFAKEGAHCVLAAHPSEMSALAALAAELEKSHGIKTWFFGVDLAVEYGPIKLYDEVKAHVPVIDVLVNNAGMMVYGDFHQVDITRQLTLVHLNIRALMLLMHMFLKDMSDRCDGRILNVSSVSAFQPTVHHAVYGASKAFVQSLSEAVHEEVRRSGVMVCTLNPSYTNTPLIKGGDFPERLWWYAVSGLSDPAVIAQKGIRALKKGKSLYIPGLKNWIIHILLQRISSRKLINYISYYALKRRL